MLHFKCGCGMYNFNFQDWISHFKHRGFRAGMRNLFNTKIQLRRDF